MCGIMGYVGDQQAADILIDGLKRLEYRGYDSAGISVIQNDKLLLARAKGKIAELIQKISNQDLGGTVGIGHTRWATHGKPSDDNAHPHRSDHVVVVHNGIIENYLELRGKLREAGVTFVSETDTEIVPHLIERELNTGKGLEDAVRSVLAVLKGAFAFAILSTKEPGKVIAAKNASPLILGLGKGENFLASDIPALLSHTRDVVVLEDGEMAVITKSGFSVSDFNGKKIEKTPKKITWSRVVAEKEGHKHFMIKEIHEQPRVIADTLRGRIAEKSVEVILDDLPWSDAEMNAVERVTLVACGTSYHAAMVGKFWIEEWAQIPVQLDLASEFRYRKTIIRKSDLFVPISQSGETADTLGALEVAKEGGAKVLSIVNIVDSSIARKSHAVLYTHAGPEIGVASTKAFTTQLICIALLALYFAQKRKTLPAEVLQQRLHALRTLPVHFQTALKEESRIIQIAKQMEKSENAYFIGRGPSFPIALEGALKLKEISYIHAEGFAGGEIKHGPIALIDEGVPVIGLATGGETFPKVLSNLEELRARGAKIIAIVTEGDTQLNEIAEHRITIPPVEDFLRPIVECVPLQLLAYHVADQRGTDVDQPRNLAKSVTVE